MQAGWNLIGNPFPFEINLGWLGERDQRVFRSDRYTEAMGTLKPYEGLFVESDEATTLLVSAAGDPNGRSATIRGISQYSNYPLDEDAWFVGFTVSSDLVTNQLAGFGMHPKAQNGYDTYDATPMPRFKQFVEVQFSNSLDNIVLERNIVKTSEQYSWSFVIETDPSAQVIRLEWNNRGWGRNDRELWLRDEVTHQLVNLREVTEYTFRSNQQKRAFTLVYGAEETLAAQLLPPRVEVGAVYPNPATAEVAIAVAVPEAEDVSSVSFTLTDGTGRIVRRGQQRLAPGHHTLSWERRDNRDRHLPAGLYFYQVSVGAQQFSGKIIYHE